jgi:hypothetical protein
MKRYTMQDRSGGVVNRIDPGLNLQQVYEMTDYSAEEVDEIADLKPGEFLLIGGAQDIYVRRDS